MGIDDLIPDDSNPQSRRGGQKSSSSEDSKEYVQEFHSDKGVKKFDEEDWENIKSFIRQKTKYSVNEVVNMESERRHDVIHDIAIKAYAGSDDVQEEHKPTQLCAVCGNDCTSAYIEIEGEAFHEMHNVMEVAEALDKEIKNAED